jgi:hypothetical protein
MQYATQIADARKRLAEATIEHRNALAVQANQESLAIQRAITAAGEAGLGSSDKVRDRNIAIALANDAEYQAAIATALALGGVVERVQAELKCLEDQRREAEWAIRERFAPVFAGRDAPDEQHHPEDQMLDVAIDRMTLTTATANGHNDNPYGLTPDEIPF